MMGHTPSRSLHPLTLLTLVILTSLGCDLAEPAPSRRVLLIGIDGASPRVIESLFAKDSLPNLARIRDGGVSGPIESLMPLLSPRIWNAIATGKRPKKHGIASFAHVDDHGIQRLYLGSDRKVHALWNMISDAGMSVSVINWWNTFPPEVINGVMVSDHFQRTEVAKREELTSAVETPTGAVVFPESWEHRLVELSEIDEPPIVFADPYAENQQLPHHGFINWRLSNYFQEDGSVLRSALEVEEAEQPDVMLVFFPGIDRISHFLWGMLEPPELYEERLRPSPTEREVGLRALERYYEYTDALIGALLERYGPNDLVIVLSDHGFEAKNGPSVLTGGHDSKAARFGAFFARGAGISAGTAAGEINVLDITPTILTWLGLPVGEDMDGDVAEFVGGEPVARIATHDTSPIERLQSTPSGSDEKMLENLRALGYLEEE